jgi:hypothetical protein
MLQRCSRVTLCGDNALASSRRFLPGASLQLVSYVIIVAVEGTEDNAHYVMNTIAEIIAAQKALC